MRLARAPTCRLPPSVDNDEQGFVIRQALDWQQFATWATWWEAGSTGADEARVYALVGQMASAGEQLALAHAAGVEVALWQESREAGESDVEDEMGMRGMAEAQCHFVIATGHALANVAVRALAMSRVRRADLAEQFKRSDGDFDPFSSDRNDWVPLNARTCFGLREVARASGQQPVIELIECIARVGCGTIWRSLLERRNEDFHRWRPQSYGVAGVPRCSPWERESGVRTLRIGTLPYEEAQGLAQEVATLARDGMFELAHAMGAFAERWPAASVHLGGPKFVPS
jgi:hypothetical protein